MINKDEQFDGPMLRAAYEQGQKDLMEWVEGEIEEFAAARVRGGHGHVAVSARRVSRHLRKKFNEQ